MLLQLTTKHQSIMSYGLAISTITTGPCNLVQMCTINLTQLCKPGSNGAIDLVQDEDDNQVDDDRCGCDGHSHTGFDLGVGIHGQCSRDGDAVHNHRKHSSKSYTKLESERRVKGMPQKKKSQTHQKDKDQEQVNSLLIMKQLYSLLTTFNKRCFSSNTTHHQQNGGDVNEIAGEPILPCKSLISRL